MLASGKNKENSLNCKLKKAVSRPKSSKKKHLLLKPSNSHCKHSLSKGDRCSTQKTQLKSVHS